MHKLSETDTICRILRLMNGLIRSKDNDKEQVIWITCMLYHCIDRETAEGIYNEIKKEKN